MDGFKQLFKKAWIALFTLLIGWGLGVSGVQNEIFAAWLFGAAAIVASMGAFVELKEWQDKYIPATERNLLNTMQGWKGVYIKKFGNISFPIISSIIISAVGVLSISLFLTLKGPSAGNSSIHSAQLSVFYQEIGRLITRPVERQMSDEDFKVWDSDIFREEERIVNWMNGNMSLSAGYALAAAPKGGPLYYRLPNISNEKYNRDWNILFQLQGNMMEIIKTTAFDKR